MQNLAAYQLKW